MGERNDMLVKTFRLNNIRVRSRTARFLVHILFYSESPGLPDIIVNFASGLCSDFPP